MMSRRKSSGSLELELLYYCATLLGRKRVKDPARTRRVSRKDVNFLSVMH